MGRLKSITDLFSRRQGSDSAVPEVDQQTRSRIIRIFALTYPNKELYGRSELEGRCAYLHEKMLLAYGTHELAANIGSSIDNHLLNYVQTCDTQKFLDWLELITEFEEHSIVGGQDPGWNDHRLFSLVDDINEALELGGCQYRLTELREPVESPKIVRVDEPLIHERAVIPALNALRDINYSKGHSSLLKALEHQRKGQHSDAARESGNALESTCRELYEKIPKQDSKIAEGHISNIIAELLKEYGIGTSLVQPIQQVSSIRNNNSNAHPRGDCSSELATSAIGSCCSAIVLLVTTAKKRRLA